MNMPNSAVSLGVDPKSVDLKIDVVDEDGNIANDNKLRKAEAQKLAASLNE